MVLNNKICFFKKKALFHIYKINGKKIIIYEIWKVLEEKEIIISSLSKLVFQISSPFYFKTMK